MAQSPHYWGEHHKGYSGLQSGEHDSYTRYMFPSITVLGFSLNTFALFIATGSLLAAGAGWLTVRRHGWAAGVWIDVCLCALVGAVIGARVAHVLANSWYFANHTDEIVRLRTGGLDWRGAVIGGLLGVAVGCALTRQLFGQTLNALAPGIALIAVGAWAGCAATVCGYGMEIPTLAYQSPLVAAELPDVYGIVLPRYQTQLWGAALSFGIFIIALLSMRLPKSDRWRFGLVMVLLVASTIAVGAWQG